MDVKKTIETLGIPKTSVAVLAKVTNQELSTSFRYPESVPAAKRERIQEVVENLTIVVTEIFPVIQSETGIKPDIRDTHTLEILLAEVREGKVRLAESEAKLRESEKEVANAIEGLRA